MHQHRDEILHWMAQKRLRSETSGASLPFPVKTLRQPSVRTQFLPACLAI